MDLPRLLRGKVRLIRLVDLRFRVSRLGFHLLLRCSEALAYVTAAAMPALPTASTSEMGDKNCASDFVMQGSAWQFTFLTNFSFIT